MIQRIQFRFYRTSHHLFVVGVCWAKCIWPFHLGMLTSQMRSLAHNSHERRASINRGLDGISFGHRRASNGNRHVRTLRFKQGEPICSQSRIPGDRRTQSSHQSRRIYLAAESGNRGSIPKAQARPGTRRHCAGVCRNSNSW